MVYRIGCFLVGGICIGAVIQQFRTGKTFGLAGKGRVNRDQEPAYFAMLAAGRIILGTTLLAAGIWLLH